MPISPSAHHEGLSNECIAERAVRTSRLTVVSGEKNVGVRGNSLEKFVEFAKHCVRTDHLFFLKVKRAHQPKSQSYPSRASNNDLPSLLFSQHTIKLFEDWKTQNQVKMVGHLFAN